MTTIAPTSEHDVVLKELLLRCGTTLTNAVQRVSIYGTPKPDGSNVVLIPHALTGNSRILDWWEPFVGPGRAVDTNRVAVIGINAIGSCYGSTGPASLAPDGIPYGSRFPVISVADAVAAQRAAFHELGISRGAMVLGGSLGGMQALQWMHDAPDVFHSVVCIGAFDYRSTMGLALSALGRTAIVDDPNFNGGDYYDGEHPINGLKLARMIATITYKSEALLDARFGRKPDRNGGDPYADALARFDVEGYLAHQGRKFVGRMDANAYLRLMRMMDLFDVREAPAPSRATRLTFVAVSSDWLVPASHIRAASERYRSMGLDSQFYELNSPDGHDGFLTEAENIGRMIAKRLP